MIDPDDKFLMDFHTNGKEKGLKILDAGVTVTTPQGTVPLEEYGSFQPQFVPMFNRGKKFHFHEFTEEEKKAWMARWTTSLLSTCSSELEW